MRTSKRVIEEVTVVGKDLRTTIESLLRDPTVYRLQLRKTNGDKLLDIPAVVGVPTAAVLWPGALAALGIAYLINYKIVVERRSPSEAESMELDDAAREAAVAVQERAAAARESIEEIAVDAKADAAAAVDAVEERVEETKIQVESEVAATLEQVADSVDDLADEIEGEVEPIAQPPMVPTEQGISAPPSGDARAMGADERLDDDLTRIKGIGPSYANVLTQAGVVSFNQLASESTEALERIFSDAGQRRPPQLEDWKEQAEGFVLAAETGIAAPDEA